MVVFFAAITMKMYCFHNHKESYFHLGITLTNHSDKNEHSLLYPQHSPCEEIYIQYFISFSPHDNL